MAVGLAHLQRTYIYVCRHACSARIFKGCCWIAQSGKTYMSAGMAWSAQIFFMPVGSHHLQWTTYMMAGTHVVQEYHMAIGSHACSEDTYMSSWLHAAQNISRLLAGIA